MLFTYLHSKNRKVSFSIRCTALPYSPAPQSILFSSASIVPSLGVLVVWSSLFCVHLYLCVAYFSFLFWPHLQQHASWFVLEPLPPIVPFNKNFVFLGYSIIPTIFLHVQCGNNFPMQFTFVCVRVARCRCWHRWNLFRYCCRCDSDVSTNILCGFSP